MDVQTVVMDFEKGCSVRMYRVGGCCIHPTQDGWHKIQKLGLVNEYNKDFRLFHVKLEGLAFLPVDEVTRGMTHLTDNAPQAAIDLVSYFDKMYVSGTFGMIGSKIVIPISNFNVLHHSIHLMNVTPT